MSPADVALAVRDAPVADEVMIMLQWLGYPQSPTLSIRSIRDWIDLIRRLTFQNSSGGKNHELKMMPSERALRLHLLRPQYAVKLVYESPFAESSFADCDGEGWGYDSDGKLPISLLSVSRSIRFVGEYKCGCTKGCTGSRQWRLQELF